MAQPKKPLMHSIILGEGPPLIVLHGFLGMADNWISLGRKWAAEGFQVHLTDLRNHGKSFWSPRFDYEILTRDLENYIHHHHLSRPHIIGHSLGGKIAMFDAIKHPENRGKYVILDIAPRQYPPRHGFIFRAMKAVDPARFHSRREVEKALEKYIPQARIRHFIMKNLQRTSQGGFRWKLNLEVLEKSMESIGQALPEDAVCLKPVLFLKGGESDYIQPEDKAQINEIFPLARVEEIPGSGHWLHAEKPREVYERITDFIRN